MTTTTDKLALEKLTSAFGSGELKSEHFFSPYFQKKISFHENEKSVYSIMP